MTDKPFVCPTPGCGMSFTNEDHLTVHRKKHDMTLNLNHGQKVVFMDQTPTPTRFIRNCEEVGLFQDLQNVNPFDEQFRKATEAAKSGSSVPLNVSALTENVDDSLHTPHIFPSIDSEGITVTLKLVTSKIAGSRNSSCQGESPEISSAEAQRADLSGETTSKVQEPLTAGSAKPQEQKRHESEANLQQNILSLPAIIANSTTLQVPVNVANCSGSLILLRPTDRHSLKIDQTVMSQKACIEPKLSSVPAVSSVQNTAASSAKMKLKQILVNNAKHAVRPLSVAKNGTISKGNVTAIAQPSTKSVSSDPPPSKRRVMASDNLDEKRRQFLERNRAAASRCRARKKEERQEMETLRCKLQIDNAAMKEERIKLIERISLLEYELSFHKHCDVTVQRQKQHEQQQQNRDQQTQAVATDIPHVITTSTSVPGTNVASSANVVVLTNIGTPLPSSIAPGIRPLLQPQPVLPVTSLSVANSILPSVVVTSSTNSIPVTLPSGATSLALPIPMTVEIAADSVAVRPPLLKKKN